jgi:hypothetical protein
VLPRAIDHWLQRATRRVRVYVGTAHVAVDLLAGWPRRQSRGLRESIRAGAGFDEGLTALARALRAFAAADSDPRGFSCDVVLADCWVVYDVVPLDVMQVSAGAAQSIIGATLADVSGVRADALEVRWQWQRDGRGAFAMAIPRDVLARLKEVLAQQGLAVKSVTGEFVAVYNAQLDRMTGPRVFFAVDRDSGAQIALLADGAIRATRFELGHNSLSGLSRAAAGVMRARGDDTAAPIDYVLDAGRPGAGNPPEAAAGWLTLSPPPWIAAQ